MHFKNIAVFTAIFTLTAATGLPKQRLQTREELVAADLSPNQQFVQCGSTSCLQTRYSTVTCVNDACSASWLATFDHSQRCSLTDYIFDCLAILVMSLI